MRGDRYGTVVAVTRVGKFRILLDRSRRTKTFARGNFEVID